MNTLELRCLASSELRAGSNHSLRGYAAVFNQLSEQLQGFRERIRPGAFSRTLQDGADVRCLLNHDPSLVLGRSRAGTLRLREDSHGLRYEVDLPPTTVGRDLYESVRRGDITQSSFGFTCVADAWPSRGLRELLDVNLIDVSPVTFPAYEGTAVGVRGMPGLRWYQGNGNVELTETERRKCRLRVLLAEMDDWKELFG